MEAPLPNIPETNSFLRDVCPHVLKDGNISSDEADFIIHCIQRGLTVTVTRDDTILFEGQSYRLSREDSERYKKSKDHLDRITKAALNREDDVLAEQYRSYKPLFPNGGRGLRSAAGDISEVRSLTGIGGPLTNRTWQFTSLVARLPKRSSGTEKDFMLF